MRKPKKEIAVVPLRPDPCNGLTTGGHSGLPFETVALVLQGGGALGAYQAGVYEGLSAAGIEPNWVAGISIGALNTAVIAGNPPEMRVQRLREFWETICRPAFYVPPIEWMQSWVEHAGIDARRAFSAFAAWRAIVDGQRDFFVPRGLTPWLVGKQSALESSLYDTTNLQRTLARLVDFDRINYGDIRVSVGAVNIRTGNFEYFDNTSGVTSKGLKPEHFMASAALPPGFPAVEIEGEFYWDGGLVSNTPLNHVLSAEPRRNTLSFQVDLWSAHGPLPENIYEVQERQKGHSVFQPHTRHDRYHGHCAALPPHAARGSGASSAASAFDARVVPGSGEICLRRPIQRDPADLPGQGMGRARQGLRIQPRDHA